MAANPIDWALRSSGIVQNAADAADPLAAALRRTGLADNPDYGTMVDVPTDQQFPGMTGRAEPDPLPPPAPPTPPDSGGVPGPVAVGGVGAAAVGGGLAGAAIGGPFGAAVGAGLGALAAGTVAAGPNVASAAFHRYNDVLSVIDYANRPIFPPDPSYDVSQDPDVIGPQSQYAAHYLDQFVGSQSKAETQYIMSRIDRGLAQEKAVQDAGWLGTLASVAAGSASPLWLIPIGGDIAEAAAAGRTARTLGAFGRAAGSFGGFAGDTGAAIGQSLGTGLGAGISAFSRSLLPFGVANAADQGILQMTQPTQTLEDSITNAVWNTISGAALTGILGGVAICRAT
jgi:hypothetical protein